MATKKSAGTTKNGRDSEPKYLGVKLSDGSLAKAGSIIIRQRGTRFVAGKNVDTGRDHTLFALKEGTVKISNTRKLHFDNTVVVRKLVDVE